MQKGHAVTGRGLPPSERPALTAGDLLDAMKAFEGRGAGPRRRRSRDAAA
jgi:hypothetical protein